jgi:hypothetical protein
MCETGLFHEHEWLYVFIHREADFGMNFHPFWYNPCKILAFYTPHNKIGIELNQ